MSSYDCEYCEHNFITEYDEEVCDLGITPPEYSTCSRMEAKSTRNKTDYDSCYSCDNCLLQDTFTDFNIDNK